MPFYESPGLLPVSGINKFKIENSKFKNNRKAPDLEF